jgi:glycosyltransferase involved in cell wall biosynthesis
MVQKIEGGLSLSVCVPVFNEELSLRGAVQDLFKTLAPLVGTLEIIIVNDGSTDTTASLAQELSKEYDSPIKVIHHPVNLGLGASYKDALSIAEGQYFTWFPGDHENSAEELVHCLPHLGQNTAVTSYHGESDKRSWLRRATSNLYTGLLNKCFSLSIKYYNGLTIFPTKVLRAYPLVSNGYALSAESLIRAVKSGCKLVELLYPLNKRQGGRSSAISFLSFLGMVKDINRNLISLIRRAR